MTQSNLIAIDLAKNIFQVAQLKGNKLKFNKPMKREPMFDLLAKAEGSKVVMEKLVVAPSILLAKRCRWGTMSCCFPLNLLKRLGKAKKLMQTMSSLLPVQAKHIT